MPKIIAKTGPRKASIFVSAQCEKLTVVQSTKSIENEISRICWVNSKSEKSLQN
jgi:hypothetical protein